MPAPIQAGARQSSRAWAALPSAPDLPSLPPPIEATDILHLHTTLKKCQKLPPGKTRRSGVCRCGFCILKKLRMFIVNAAPGAMLVQTPGGCQEEEAASVASDPGRPANESQRLPLSWPPSTPSSSSSASNLQTEMLPNGIAPISIKRNFIGKFDI